MSRFSEFKSRMAAGDIMSGTFVKTPSIEIVEVLAHSGLDFICLDAEHAPFDRARMDGCLAIARALDVPALVRVASASAENILQALDCGAVGVVCPHVRNAEEAAQIARWSRFGHGGRGYAGSSRWAAYTTQGMGDLLAKSQDETVVIAQIEEPEGVEAAAEIAGTAGIDGVFLGPADLSVAFGHSDLASEDLATAVTTVGKSTKAAGKTYMSFVPGPAKAAEWLEEGMTMFFISSEQGWMLNGAKAAAKGIKDLGWSC